MVYSGGEIRGKTYCASIHPTLSALASLRMLHGPDPKHGAAFLSYSRPPLRPHFGKLQTFGLSALPSRARPFLYYIGNISGRVSTSGDMGL